MIVLKTCQMPMHSLLPSDLEDIERKIEDKMDRWLDFREIEVRVGERFYL